MERRLAAILSADVKGYSRLMAENEVATIETLVRYRDIMASLIEQHRVERRSLKVQRAPVILSAGKLAIEIKQCRIAAVPHAEFSAELRHMRQIIDGIAQTQLF